MYFCSRRRALTLDRDQSSLASGGAASFLSLIFCLFQASQSMTSRLLLSTTEKVINLLWHEKSFKKRFSAVTLTWIKSSINSSEIKCHPSDENKDVNKLWIEFGTRRHDIFWLRFQIFLFLWETCYFRTALLALRSVTELNLTALI